MAEGGVGLDPVICDLCEDKPAQFFCRTCDGNMCIDCKNENKKKKMFLRHDVVKMTLTRKMELDGFGYCNVHPENKYELSCQSCEIPVCTKCISGKHNGHNMKDISTAYLDAKRRISEMMNEVDNYLIPTYRRNIEAVESVLCNVKKQSKELEQTVVQRSKSLTDFIHSIEKEVTQKSLVDSARYTDQIAAKKKEIESHLSFLQKLRASLLEQRDAKSMTDLILYTNENSKLAEREIKFQIPSFQPAYFLSDVAFEKTLNILFGLLLPSRLVNQKDPHLVLVKAKKLKEIKTTVILPCGLSVSYQNQAAVWVRGGENRVYKMDMNGTTLATFPTETDFGKPSGLIELEDGNILYTDMENKKIRKVAKNLQKMGEINTEWYPIGMCLSLSGHILVCVSQLKVLETNESDIGKILRMNCQGNIFQEIQRKSNNENLYTRPICVSENVNQDICVSDCTKCSVIVVDRTGIFRFAYEGGFIQNYDRSFGPAELDTDKDGNILISDYGNSLVHLLDIDGRFLQYILTAKDGISKPRGLKVDDDERLWITEIGTQCIKVFQYLD